MKPTSSTVAILGFGPSSLFAIMACNNQGIIPAVYTKEKAVTPVGAFYYHFIPPPFNQYLQRYKIPYRYIGCVEEYKRKQGLNQDTKTSWGSYDLCNGYSPHEVNSLIVPMLKYILIEDSEIKLFDLFDLAIKYRHVFCSIPFHTGKFDKIAVTSQNSEYKTDNYICYNGMTNDIVVRESKLFGTIYKEYPKGFVPSNKHVFISDILYGSGFADFTFQVPSNVIFIGRNAKFDRRYLAHYAYGDVLNELQ